MTKWTDEKLSKAGVKFLPWVGDDYEKGFRGRRLLVLGESHYDCWNGKKHELNKEITRINVEWAIRRKDSAEFYKYVEQALLNETRVGGWAPGGGDPLWRQLAVYNFVQSPVRGGAGVRPTSEQFTRSNPQFRTVLEFLRPERVWVCGIGLWGKMEEIDGNECCLHDSVQAYRLSDGTKVWCLATNHPSRGFSWNAWHPKIKAFLERPEDAVTLLKREQE